MSIASRNFGQGVLFYSSPLCMAQFFFPVVTITVCILLLSGHEYSKNEDREGIAEYYL